MKSGAERVQIRARLYHATVLFLWRVTDRPEGGHAGRLEKTCNTKIDQFDFAGRGDHDIAGFHIPIDHGRIERVEVLKCFHNLEGDFYQLRLPQLSPGDPKLVLQCPSFNYLHYEIMILPFAEFVEDLWD